MGNAIRTFLFERAQAKRQSMGQQRPRLSLAFEFQEKNTLPHRIKDPDTGNWRKLEPGETHPKAKLYSIWHTPLKELGDFGLGIGLYFGTIVGLASIMFVCGLLNIYSLVYYASDDYSAGQDGVDTLLVGSAVCTDKRTVCLDTSCTTTDKMNNCNINTTQCALDLTMIIVLFIFLAFISKGQSKAAELMDVSEQTTQDYAIVVQDPDPDATDPDEWRDFFESRFGRVVYVSVAINNGELLWALGKKRIAEREFKLLMRENGITNMDAEISDPLPDWKKKFQVLGIFRNMAYWQNKLKELNEEIAMLKKMKYEAAKVFVVFETEEAQRYALKTMTTGLIPSILEVSSKISDKNKFRGTNILKVEEPVEPTEVKWQNLGVELFTLWRQQLVNLAFSAVLVFLFALVIWQTSNVNAALAATFISITNSVIPPFLKALTAREEHHNESSYQRSLLFKLVLARWMNTGFIIFIINTIYNYIIN